MSQIVGNEYLTELDVIRRVSASQRETMVREAFKDLLKNWGKENRLTFIEVTVCDFKSSAAGLLRFARWFCHYHGGRLL